MWWQQPIVEGDSSGVMNHHPPSPVGRALTVGLGALPFIVITLLIFKHWPPLERWDQSVSARAAAYGATHERVIDFWQVVGAVVLPWTSRAVVVVVAAYLWQRRARVLSFWLLVSAAAELGLVQAVKYIFGRPGPAQMLVDNDGWSYVSGHYAAAAFVMAGAWASSCRRSGAGAAGSACWCCCRRSRWCGSPPPTGSR